jgi:hypothetical protein
MGTVSRAPNPPGLSSETNLTRFDLDFPGGTPKELVAAIQKAMDRPMNAIVPDDLATVKLPAFRMKHVNLPQMFEALGAASHKMEAISNYRGGMGVFNGGFNEYSYANTSYGFRTEGNPTDDSIWYFFVDKPGTPPASPFDPNTKICRFYSLAPYLERGATVDDITTAIETGWKMLGDTSPPSIRFHKDTKLLIAVGEASKLDIIDAALKALEGPKPKAASRAPAALPSAATPTEEPKPEE